VGGKKEFNRFPRAQNIKYEPEDFRAEARSRPSDCPLVAKEEDS
jgi:hypothetical protein